MNPLWIRSLGLAAIALAALAEPIIVHAKPIEKELFPVDSLLFDKKHALTYPTVAGSFMVYNENHMDEFSVVRVPTNQVDMDGKRVDPTMLNEVLRQGVALKDGGIGYVSNRIGPVSAWFWQGKGDSHIAIANMALFRGGLIPGHLNASANAQTWCFDATLQKIRHNQLLNEFSNPNNSELLGQNWRIYNSNFVAYKMAYRDTKTGTKNKLHSPSLFVFKRASSELSMLPNAFDGTISPDGKQIAFVREVHGNYDLWLQNLDGTGLTQLTSNTFGDFEPAFSPDGKKLAFVSNRHSKGNVRHTSIYIIDINTGETARITNAPRATDGGVAWKDDHTLVFHSNRDLNKPQSRTISDWNLWQVAFR
ncbi:MAG: hypothetical protein Q9M20_05190 [Mariprofundaceae bacterium]|nr:hypothetical protein [Mariprofundaceae bacterium]